MSTTPFMPRDEALRLAAVRRYDVLDTPPDGAFDRIAAVAAHLFDVPIAIVSVVDTDRIWFKSHHGLDATQVAREPGLCASAILGSEPWIVTDAVSDPRTLVNSLVSGAVGLRFYAGVPLTTSDGYNLGTLCVIDRLPRQVTDAETEMLQHLAATVMDELELRLSARQAVGAAERRLHDVEQLAAALQASLLPPSLPRVPFLELGARYQPAHRFEVGGDFYDVFPVDDRAWGFVIGDVCGKGPQAAGRTSCARYSLRGAAVHESGASSVLDAVNQALLAECGGAVEPAFVTALYARAQPVRDGVEIAFASAGHPLPTLLRADGTVEEVGRPGALLGVLPAVDAPDCSVWLSAGDTMLLVTDGVHDSGRSRGLQQEGVEQVLRGCRGLTADAVVERVHRAAAVAQRDDIALLALRVPPA
ncbi:MAG: GAF domain-containing SpoIIE family protein phosphatase [Mycobacteriales bacterium]